METMSFSHPKIHPLTLQFGDGGLEQEFLDDYNGKVLRQVRVALLVGIFLYAIFGILDAFIIPEDRVVAWVIRFAIVIPVLAMVHVFSYSRHFSQLMQPLLVLIILITGFGIITMLTVAEAPGTYLYYAGLILVTMYAYTFLRLRFKYATFASWTIVLAYELAANLISPLPTSMLVNNTFFLLSANIIGMFAGYQMELSNRRDFLQRKLIRELEEKKHLMEKEKILKDLHDGVGGTTTNIAMLAEMAQEESSSAELKKTLSSIAELANDSLAEIQGFLHSLDVRELSWEACVAELRYRGASILDPHGISLEIQASVEDAHEQPGSLLALNLFKIFRESLTNIVKHAQATAVDVRLRVDRSGIRLCIQDNGSGFSGETRRGRGLANMQERAVEIGGTITVTTSAGTLVELSIPLPVQYRAQGWNHPAVRNRVGPCDS